MNKYQNLLKKNDLKITQKRTAVLKVIVSQKKPITIEGIFNLASQQIEIDLTTVYRIINTLTDKKIIKKLHIKSDVAHFEYQENHHHHLICQLCDSTQAIYDACSSHLAKTIQSKHNFLLKDHRMEFYGICNKCNNLRGSYA